MHGELYLAESALSERFTEDVVPEACALWMRILLLLIVLLVPALVAFVALLATVVIRGLIIGILSLLLSTLRRLMRSRGCRRHGRRGLRLIIVFNSSHVMLFE